MNDTIYDLRDYIKGYQQFLDEMTRKERREEPERARAYRVLIHWFTQHPDATKQEVLAFRDQIMEQGQAKRQPGGPYEHLDTFQMELTTEGRVVVACQDLISQMNISAFLPAEK